MLHRHRPLIFVYQSVANSRAIACLLTEAPAAPTICLHLTPSQILLLTASTPQVSIEFFYYSFLLHLLFRKQFPMSICVQPAGPPYQPLCHLEPTLSTHARRSYVSCFAVDVASSQLAYVLPYCLEMIFPTAELSLPNVSRYPWLMNFTHFGLKTRSAPQNYRSRLHRRAEQRKVAPVASCPGCCEHISENTRACDMVKKTSARKVMRDERRPGSRSRGLRVVPSIESKDHTGHMDREDHGQGKWCQHPFVGFPAVDFLGYRSKPLLQVSNLTPSHRQHRAKSIIRHMLRFA